MVRAFTDAEKEQIKNSIVKVASKMFKEKPYRQVKISDITKELGIAKGSFYTFFSSKEELLIVIFAMLEKQFHDQIAALMSKANNKKQFLIEVMCKLTEECRNNELFKSMLSGDVMQEVFLKIPEHLKQQLLEADQQLLGKLIAGDMSLKVSEAMAIDLLRSLFYLQSATDELNTDINQFNYHMISAVVNEIFE